MKKRVTDVMKWVLLAVFLLAAGCCYSCDRGGKGIRLDEQESAAGTSEYSEAAETETEKVTDAVFYVYVCGEVAEPGVYTMQEGQRIYEAVELAGGFTDQAAADVLNLAEPVADGMKIMVPDAEQVEAMRSSDGISESDQAVQSRINLNTATKEELMTLRGIGETRAEDIIQYRETQGGFSSIEQIKEISGIKDAAFEKIKDSITV